MQFSFQINKLWYTLSLFFYSLGENYFGSYSYHIYVKYFNFLVKVMLPYMGSSQEQCWLSIFFSCTSGQCKR